MIKTISMCPTCFREIPAVITESNGKIFMQKRCRCGESFGVVEPDAALFYALQGGNGPLPFNSCFFFNVTDRCNTVCKYCYYPKNGAQDPPISDLLTELQTTPRGIIYLTGGEPTARPDFVEVVRAISSEKRLILTLTNGIALADPQLVDKTLSAASSPESIDFAFSLHPREDSQPEVYEAKIRALSNLYERGKTVDLSFTIDAISKVVTVVDEILRLRDFAYSFRIRSAFHLWNEVREVKRIFVSDLLKEIGKVAKARGLSCCIDPEGDNNIYHLNVIIDGLKVRLISCPDITSVDFAELRPSGPYVRAYTGEFANVIHAGFINGGVMRGWLNGRRIDDLTMTMASGAPASAKPDP